MKKIKIGIIGYGNLGRGVECAIAQNPDMKLIGVFTRRNLADVNTISDVNVYNINECGNFTDKIDVMILCGGSATDLPLQGPEFASMFNTVDSFDTHAKIPEYFNKVNESAAKSGKVALISVGWDPGLFSIERLLFESVLTNGKSYTFWGKGVSQGHSDAIRRVKGVKDGKQYTIPIDEAIKKARNGNGAEMTNREKHLRECYVVAEDGADKAEIEMTIKNMPDYFADYDTVVHFITSDELKENHSGMPHGGTVIRCGKTGKDEETKNIMEFSINLESNPEFTASVLIAYARAVYKLANEGFNGAKTVFDIPMSYLSPKSPEELRKNLL